MYIQSLSVDAIGGIPKLNLSFDRSMNIICGPNGIGKTTILDCIAHLLSGGTVRLKRSALSDSGSVRGCVVIRDEPVTLEMSISQFAPNKEDHSHGVHVEDAEAELLVLKVGRTFDYRALDAVSRDVEKPRHVVWNDARNGVPIHDVKNWFVNRYLYSAHDTLTTAQLENLQLAKSAFGLLNPSFDFSRVDASTNEIMVRTPTGEIYFEYLSSGFKSILSIVFGIIKEIEYRFAAKGIYAKEFSGIVLIDEVELHLHPEWQSRVCSVLQACFPRAQFVCTTHSPHVVQSADASQVVAIELSDDTLSRRDLSESKYGFKGWTIEEVLVDVMGMVDLTTAELRRALSEFESAVDAEDAKTAKSQYIELTQMLHPQSRLRKLIRMQLVAAGGEP